MNSAIRVRLKTTPEQEQKLQALQAVFANACNALSPTVQRTRIWNRVALHHLSYRDLRDRFPQLGSQMVCNAIYSVSRASRDIYQNPRSPFCVTGTNSRPLPLIRFSNNSPVYFDRHTLSAKNGQLSMLTLDGRMRFDLAMTPADEARFNEDKVREIVLSRGLDGAFELSFLFHEGLPSSDTEVTTPNSLDSSLMGLPEHVMVEEAR